MPGPARARTPAVVDSRFVIVAGKGGVGRTTVAAALASLAARHGRRVLLCQTRARDGLGRMLGRGSAGPDIEAAGRNLWVVNIEPRAALREYGMMLMKFPAVYRAVFENRPLRAFLRAVPGLYEFAMFGKACFHVAERQGGRDRFDTVIFDGPATGHLLQMLRLPKAVLDVITAGPVAREARAAYELLKDPRRTVAHLVTLAEDMPAAEAEDLYRSLRDEFAVPMNRLIVNALFPDRWRPDGAPGRVLDRLEGASLPAALAEAVAVARDARARREMQDRNLQRLSTSVPLRPLLLPMIFAPSIGPDELHELARVIELQA